MAITSLRPIKAKNRRTVVKGSNTVAVGFTDSEARGIFGRCYEYTDEEIDRIERYEAKRAERELKRTRPVRESMPGKGRNWAKTPMEEKRDELADLGLNVVGFNDGESVTYF